ncbi:pyridoxamine 5'-phosphate oxidase family protein [Oscillatoria sp. CS-180]|uniref:Npun_F5749 family FMN-dependent PPOX-type flavoprotein n=1 Tax=Oscillatoria sp. CS-180 TaxID=3021720 RepID=UPI00232E2986|nr:Npun_F5749 family FMN-dependent PPOX-type flavoprotein [Oscillatoria sp. CS-180]MDB9527773.1 pyridoxamine 5'-phosphate oxidase family protein [Oscillatoria sp. CS-180]
MSLAPWRSPLARALHRNRSRPYSRYPQFATVRPDGRPANRTIVFRDFEAETNRLMFISDRRSDKLEHLKINPYAELCWYFTQTREQFRLGGKVAILETVGKEAESDQMRQKVWEKISDKARQQFAWPHPGKPRVSEGYESVELDEQTPLDTFIVLMLDPDIVDHLELRGEPQNRYQYQRQSDGSWKSLEVNP